jgi:hypothetical protein
MTGIPEAFVLTGCRTAIGGMGSALVVEAL